MRSCFIFRSVCNGSAGEEVEVKHSQVRTHAHTHTRLLFHQSIPQSFIIFYLLFLFHSLIIISFVCVFIVKLSFSRF